MRKGKPMTLLELVARPVGVPFEAWVYWAKDGRASDVRCDGPEYMCNNGLRPPDPRFEGSVAKWNFSVSDGDLDVPEDRVDDSNSWDWGGRGNAYFYHIECGCHSCFEQPYVGGRMVLCPKCGNKRCPHASDHRIECTNSNEPGQLGSVYGPSDVYSPGEVVDVRGWEFTVLRTERQTGAGSNGIGRVYLRGPDGGVYEKTELELAVYERSIKKE